jgi:hypothetical protein
MPYSVILLEEAIKDIKTIYRYIQKSGSKNAAQDNGITGSHQKLK